MATIDCCDKCKGRGRVLNPDNGCDEMNPKWKHCKMCNGKGVVSHGQEIINDLRDLNAATRNGERIEATWRVDTVPLP